MLIGNRLRAIGYLLLLSLLWSTPASAQTSATPEPTHPELVLNIGHVATVRAVAFSPDGRTIASAADDRTVKLWDATTGALRNTLTGHRAGVITLIFAPDSKSLLSAGRNGVVHGWSIANGTRLGTLAPPDTVKLPLRAIAVTLVGGTTPLVAGAGSDGAVTLWKAVAGSTTSPTGGEHPEIVATVAPPIKAGQRLVLSLAFSADGTRLATGAGNGSVIVYDASDGSLQYRLRAHAMPVVGLAFSPDGKYLADASSDGESALFDLTTGKQAGTLQMNRPGDGMGAIAFAPDGSGAIVTGGAHGPQDSDFLMLWNARTPTAPKQGALLRGHERFVFAVAFSPDGKTIASAGRDRTIRLWDRTTGTPKMTLGGFQQLLSVAAQPGPTGKSLASGGADGMVRLWNRETGEMTQTLAGHTGPVRAVAYTPDGKILASGGRDKTVRLWDAATGKALRTITGATGPINALAFLPDGRGLVVGCSYKDDGPTNGTILLLDATTGSVIRTFNDNNMVGPVISVAVSPDGKSIVAGTGYVGSSQIRFQEVATGAVKSTDEVPMPVTSVTFSPDGKQIAAGTAQRLADQDASPIGEEIRLYNGQTFAYQKSLVGPSSKTEGDSDPAPSGVVALAFVGGGKGLVSAGLDGGLRLWDPRTDNGPAATLPGAHQGEATGALAVYGGNRIVSGGQDNVLLIHTADAALGTGELLARLLPVPGDQPTDPTDDYLVVTADGYYDGSAGAARRISWRVGDDLFPVEAYESLLHKPDEIRRILASSDAAPPPPPDTLPTPSPAHAATESATAAQRFRQGGLVPPLVTFETPSDGDPLPNANTVTVRVVVSDMKGVARLEVLTDGRSIGAKPIQMGSKPISLGSKAIQLGSKAIQLGSKPIQMGSKPIPAGHTVEQTFETQVPVPTGNDPVTLTAIAYGADNLTGREQIRLLRGGAVGGGATGGNLYILAVGVSTYKNPKFDLKYARSDAEAFTGLWKTSTGSASLYNHVEAKLLCDTDATAENVRAALFHLLEAATPKDTVALFLSGHGLQAGEDNYYFATTEIDPATADTVAKTALPWTALQTTLAGVKAQRVLLFLDACHSGGALGEGQQASGERMAELLAKRAGVLVFSSSRGSEYSYELDSEKHGAFTEAIIEAIGEGKADLDIAGGGKDGVITAEELLAFLRARVPKLTDNRQTPTCPLLRDFGDAYPIARLR